MHVELESVLLHKTENIKKYKKFFHFLIFVQKVKYSIMHMLHAFAGPAGFEKINLSIQLIDFTTKGDQIVF